MVKRIFRQAKVLVALPPSLMVLILLFSLLFAWGRNCESSADKHPG